MRRRTARGALGAIAALGIAGGGFAAAGVGAALPPIPTVSVPPLPGVPTVPTPTLPPAAPPAAPAPPPLPAAPSVPPVGSTVPDIGAPATQLASTASTPPGSSGTTAQSGASRTPSASQGATSTNGLRMAPVRVVAAPGPRRAVVLRFRLNRASGVVVVVRGPLPSCSTAARFNVAGRRGDNAIRFAGSVRGSRLAPGLYVVGLRLAGSTRIRWTAIRVLPQGARAVPQSVVSEVVASCTAVTSARVGFPAGGFAARPSAPSASTEPSAADPPVALAPSVPDEPTADVLPFADVVEAADELPAALGFAVVGIGLLALFGIVAYTIRFLRTE